MTEPRTSSVPASQRDARRENLAIGGIAGTILGALVWQSLAGLRAVPEPGTAVEPLPDAVQIVLMTVVVLAAAGAFWLAARQRRGGIHRASPEPEIRHLEVPSPRVGPRSERVERHDAGASGTTR